MARRGFTLIELLVVIAIIAILAAILFPVFARAREKARQTSCLSNVKQLMLGLLMYVQDYDERFPNYYWGEGRAGNPNSATWFRGIYPYVKNTQLYQCPSSAADGAHTWGVWLTGPFASGFHMDYGYNEIIANWGGAVSLGRLKYPAETVVIADCRTSSWLGGYWRSGNRAFLRRIAFAEPRGYVGCGCPPNDSYVPSSPEDHTRHNGGSNIGFADGHAKWAQWNQCRTVSGGGSLRYYGWEW